jgi:hypothetical protein
VNVVQAWRQQASWLLITFMVLDVLGVVYTRTAGASLNAGQPITGQLIWLALDSLLAWRIWRHGRLAQIVLLILRASLLLLVVISAGWPWPPYLLGVLAITSAQTMLLVSPAIRDHVRTKLYGSWPSDD